jgi:hypothetical protein
VSPASTPTSQADVGVTLARVHADGRDVRWARPTPSGVFASVPSSVVHPSQRSGSDQEELPKYGQRIECSCAPLRPLQRHPRNHVRLSRPGLLSGRDEVIDQPVAGDVAEPDEIVAQGLRAPVAPENT